MSTIEERTEVAKKFKELLRSRHRGVSEVWVSEAGDINILCRPRQRALQIKLDLLRAGFATVHIQPPNPYSQRYRVSASLEK